MEHIRQIHLHRCLEEELSINFQSGANVQEPFFFFNNRKVTLRGKSIDFLSSLFAHYKSTGDRKWVGNTRLLLRPHGPTLHRPPQGVEQTRTGYKRVGGSRTARPQRQLISNLPAVQINKRCHLLSEQLFLDKNLCVSVFTMEYKS